MCVEFHSNRSVDKIVELVNSIGYRSAKVEGRNVTLIDSRSLPENGGRG
jgi:hypothetical protein